MLCVACILIGVDPLHFKMVVDKDPLRSRLLLFCLLPCWGCVVGDACTLLGVDN